jgi:signal transduction histidine kinase
MVVGLVASLRLYQQSRQNSELFLERTNTVKEVLLLLERTERLKNLLRKTIYDRAEAVDSALAFTSLDKVQVDSILQRLHHIVLYDDQRQRVDTIQSLINDNFALLLKPHYDVSHYKGVSAVLSRARTYAESRLLQQQQSYQHYQSKVTLWVNAILITSFCLFVVATCSSIFERIAKSKLKYLHESILTSSSNGVCLFELDAKKVVEPKLVFSNMGAVVRHNNGSESIVNLSNIVYSNHTLLDAVKLAFVGGKTIVREYEYKEIVSPVWLIITMNRIGERNVVMNYQDITPLKQYETELRARVNELESVNKDLEQFAHATSHDLKEPFRKIRVMGDLVIKGYNVDNHPKYIEAMVKAATKGSELVEQILNYSKVQFDKSELTLVDLNLIVHQVKEDLELAIMEKDADVQTDSLPTIKANRVQMTQLFLNLIGNALKFSATGRKPQVIVRCLEVSGSDIPGMNPDMRYFAISIHDNGIGFDQAYAEKIFHAFERLNNKEKYAGFGLGLSLCKRIVLNHGGAIRAKSRIGEGSTFTIYLPHFVESIQ